MKVVIIGATGTIGKAVTEILSPRHQVIEVGYSGGQHRVDIRSSEQIHALFDKVGRVDAIISTTGNLHFGPLADMTAADFNLGLQDKLLGQVNIALIGQHYLNDKGSITLTSGIVSHEPILGGANASTVNGAIDSFVQAAAMELGDGKRINSVNPSVVTESWSTYGPFFAGFESVPVARVAKAFQRSVEGPQSGRVYRVW